MDRHTTNLVGSSNTNVDSTGTPLGVGELSAIILAEQLHADLVLMDDLDGRIEAERRHLKVIGTARRAEGRRISTANRSPASP
jgi:predicted nucleic acid-binding protein